MMEEDDITRQLEGTHGDAVHAEGAHGSQPTSQLRHVDLLGSEDELADGGLFPRLVVLDFLHGGEEGLVPHGRLGSSIYVSDRTRRVKVKAAVMRSIFDKRQSNRWIFSKQRA